jgi:RHS repeat-associated protein
MVKVTDFTTFVTLGAYEYDGLGRRISETADSTTRHYYYSAGWQVLEERVGSSTDADRQFVWGTRYVDDLVLRDRDTSEPKNGVLNERLYALQDPNFNVAALANTGGAIQERYVYEAFGRAKVLDADFSADADGASDFGWEYRYTGRRYDLATGLYHYRNRPYHAELGCFLGRDPIGYGGGVNLYDYVGNAPLDMLDPFGLVPKPKPKNLCKLKTLFCLLAKKGKKVKIVLPKGVLPGGTHHFKGDLGKKYPKGVKFDADGFPDFSPYLADDIPGLKSSEVTIPDMTGVNQVDFPVANELAGIDEATRKRFGLTWHHHQDMETMQLIPSEINHPSATPHTGGAAFARAAREAGLWKTISGMGAAIFIPRLWELPEDATWLDYGKAGLRDTYDWVSPDPGVLDILEGHEEAAKIMSDSFLSIDQEALERKNKLKEELFAPHQMEKKPRRKKGGFWGWLFGW